MFKFIILPYLIVSVIATISVIVASLVVYVEVEKTYGKPTLKNWSNKKSTIETIYNYLKVAVFSFTPGLQLILIYVCMTMKDEVLKQTEEQINYFIKTGERR